MPLEVDERSLPVADAINELVDEADPLVEVRVLHGVAVIRRAVVVDIGAEAVAREHALVAGDREVHFHAFRKAFPTRTGYFQLLFKARPARIEEESRAVLELADGHEHILDLQSVAKIGRDFGIDVVEGTSRQMADEVKDLLIWVRKL